MKIEGIPHELRDWRGTALALWLISVPQLAALELVPAARDLHAAAAFSGVVTRLLLLVAAVLLYVHWRSGSGPRVARVVVALTVATVPAITLESGLLNQPDRGSFAVGWLIVVHLVVGLAAFALLVVRRLLPMDPLVLGITLGGTLACAALLVTEPMAATVMLRPGPTLTMVGQGLVLAVTLGVAHRVLRSDAERWVAVRLALAVTLLGLHAALSGPGTAGPTASIVALIAAVIAAVVLSSTSLSLLRLEIRTHQQTFETLSVRIHEVEAEMRTVRERLHEIGGTVAGIASASRLIHTERILPVHRRSVLEHMMDSEISRLERLISAPPTDPLAHQVDETIGPVVLLHQTRGQVIHWEPSGLEVRSRPDDLAEVVGTLLDNVAEHAPGAEVTIAARAVGDVVELTVSDTGPGISPAVRDRLFDWGVRGPDSSGQGIGLAVAQRLMVEQHGFLRSRVSPSSAACFVIGLPREVTGRGAVNCHA